MVFTPFEKEDDDLFLIIICYFLGLFQRGNLKKGETLLVTGAGGGMV